MKNVEEKKSICTWCKGECGVIVRVKDNHLVNVIEDPDWPRKVWPATRACVRLKAAREWFYHPERLNFPLKRAGERGEGRWQRVSWDQALDEIAGKIASIKKQYGAEAFSSSVGTGYRTDEPSRTHFMQLLGSANAPGQSTICFGPRSVMADVIAGNFHNYAIRPMTKCVVLLGVEPLISRPLIAKVMLEAIKNGAKLITLDPRRTRSAAMSDVWLQLRPGTDCAVLMGMINVIISEELYDREFVDKYCYGFDKLKERAAKYPPQVAEGISSVPAARIVEAARMYASSRPGIFIEGMGVEHLQNDTEVLHARWILAALTGNIDVPGGEEFYGPHPQIKTFSEITSARMSQKAKDRMIGEGKYGLFSWKGYSLVAGATSKVWGKPVGVPMVQARCHGPMLYRAMATGQPYPVRAMITLASNPMVTQGNTKVVYKGLKSLDLYVVVDFWMTPCAELADYVLPAACWLERPILWDFNTYSSCMIAGEAALPESIPDEYDHRRDFDFWRGLGIRMGQAEMWPWKTLEECYDEQVKPTGMTHNEYVNKIRCGYKALKYRKYEQTGFGTPTGKVELYSTILEKLGYDPLPEYHEPTETRISQAELAKEYPLTLITGGRVREFYHSEWRQIDSVRKRHPDPLVQIHPGTAAKLGIQEGDWVWIETPRGRVRNKATLFDGMAPDIVHTEHGWWLPEMPGEEPWLHGVWQVNCNVLMDDNPDICSPAIGTWPLRTALCRVYKAKIY